MRRETNVLEQSLAEMAQVKKLLADLNTNMQSKEQLSAIGNIADVLAEYEKKALMFYNDIERYKTIDIGALDKLAKVNDTSAAEGLAFLRKSNETKYSEMRAKTQKLYSEYQYQLIIWTICTSFIYWIVLTTFINQNKSLRHSLLELKVIKDLSPIALILTDNKGRIL